LETSGEANSFFVLCTPVARARSIHCCKKRVVSKARHSQVLSCNVFLELETRESKSFYGKILVSLEI
jgi:hypothetical protein